jgi:prephenate dehydrogenase
MSNRETIWQPDSYGAIFCYNCPSVTRQCFEFCGNERFMQRWNRVAIVGVGLIGGSIGMALRQRRLAGEVVGIGRRPESLRVAKRVGAVDTTSTSLPRGVAEAELVVVCTPVEQIVAQVQTAAEHCAAKALITDAGSTKASIVGGLTGSLPRGVRFIGSHPLAGGEKTGPGVASASLFEGRTVVITPSASNPPRDVQAVARFWKALGAKTVECSPEEHDRALAASSHLPHLIASALAAATPHKCLPLTASGWADTTRIAAGDPELWTQIFTDNQRHLLDSLGQFEQVLAALRQAIERKDRRTLTKLLQEAKHKRDAVGS